VERTTQNVGSGLLAQPDQKPNVMDRDQPEPEDVFHHEEVSQIAPRVRRTGLTIAAGVERRRRFLERCPPHIEPAGGKPRGTVAAVPGCGHAVEHVDPSRDPLQQIGGKANAHKITGSIHRQRRRQQLDDTMHDRF
jgi:hypothetical protein